MRTRKLCCLTVVTAAAVALELAALPRAQATGTVASGGPEPLHVVRPGQSIQTAVELARPGDTIELLPGVYRENIQITTSRLTIRGAGSRTVLRPAKKASSNACGKAGHGLCVTGTAQQPVTNVRIQSLTVSGFPKNGIWATHTDRLRVRRVTAADNGQQGIGQEMSIRGVFVRNVLRGNRESGIHLVNTNAHEAGAIDTRGAEVAGNRLSGNGLGVVIRRLRNLTVEQNTVLGNCGGLFVIGDENRPRAGDLTLRHNAVLENNRLCPANERLPAIQGAGIVITGSEGSRVTGNQVFNNRGSSPMSGGVVLFNSFVGVPNTKNEISANVLNGNGPVDLADRDRGPKNTFTDNVCGTSVPAGRC
ncbi:right-handed parallel beta-helix repeat-containing protein [Streptomyces sp. NA02950]|uniref:right-handed parallel beta-helix repeat-containing protein n=1 Tax=Streptomyces sp. NA02950 TaxID=2742137 RepID=UPI0015928F0A|nr:right-handed parallel beta-helix repeat-containing protein [Streptomyces sp. NA02950]QKV91863.1 right-handed parallel beta-helix repeat-containing protein [Streptomyces sp. NA02950]